MNEAAGVPEPISLQDLTLGSIHGRRHLVSRDDFATNVSPTATVEEFLASLPGFLGANELRAAAQRTAASIRRGSPVVVAIGGHVVKVGIGPVLIDLMERGCISALVMNGATAIHDYEIALCGETSEDVGAGILDGTFGMIDETPSAFAQALAACDDGAPGLGRAIGDRILQQQLPHRDASVLAAAARLDLPLTVHVGVGTDTIHMHPGIDGALLGAASHYDFRLLAAVVTGLAGGAWINIGSAVVLPEVFLKVVSIARNLGNPLDGVTAINFDMLQHYRTSRNVLQRPVERGISITGHHEINIPLFRVALLAALEREE
ncbi:MAG: hypothetical protein AAF581_03995 [Planctomycetota bacterium]